MRMIEPLNDHVVVAPDETEEVRGGIIIPDTVKEKPITGTVLAVGPGRLEKGERVPVGILSGDIIVCGRYAGSDIILEGKKYIILHEDEILGILREVSEISREGNGLEYRGE